VVEPDANYVTCAHLIGAVDQGLPPRFTRFRCPEEKQHVAVGHSVPMKLTKRLDTLSFD
jgi:hypothetical protein